MFIGLGTLVNVGTILLGGSLGVLVGHRLPERTRKVVTDGLGLVTLLIAASSAMTITDRTWASAVGSSAPMLIVLGALLIGGTVGSLLRLEDRLEDVGGWLQRRMTPGQADQAPQEGRQGTEGRSQGGRALFVQGFVTAAIVFCVGPLTILGSINEGLGHGADQLLLKSALDGFASIAFAASFGWGVAASALAVLVIQGSLTVLGALLGNVIPDAELAALTTTGGLILVAVAFRLLDLKQIKVADLLPALIVAPALTALVAVFH